MHRPQKLQEDSQGVAAARKLDFVRPPPRSLCTTKEFVFYDYQGLAEIWLDTVTHKNELLRMGPALAMTLGVLSPAYGSATKL
jgi:hypothetical protein